MQSSFASKFPTFVRSSSKIRPRPATVVREIHCRYLSQGHLCYLREGNPRNNDSNCEQGKKDSTATISNPIFFPYTSAQRRIHSTLASTSFWRGLHQAVQQGNGNYAEEIAEQVLREYYESIKSLSSEPSQEHHEWMTANRPDTTNSFLDSQIFSLVLQAWKNSERPSLHSALRAHNLLLQMAALADQDVLCDPPSKDDYLAVLECWYQAAAEGDENNPPATSNGSIDLIVQHVEELWEQMNEKQRRERMIFHHQNHAAAFGIDERAYTMFASLLAKSGKAARAEALVEEALGQVKRQPHYGGPQTTPNYDFHTKAVEKCEDDFFHPKVDIDLCHAVLRAHLVSKESRAPQRAEAFLQTMATNPYLPNPTVDSYNLLLERWLMSSEATKKHRLGSKIANKAEDIIHQMKENRVQPNLTSYQYAIDAIARSGDAIRAETMLANLVKDYFLQYDADLKPNLTPFHSVLWAYSLVSEYPKQRTIPDAAERAESILNNMKELSDVLDTYPTVWSYNVVLKCWAHSQSRDAPDRATNLYDDLQSHRYQEENPSPEDEGYGLRPLDLGPDETSMNTLLTVLSRSSGAERTEEQLRKFFDAHSADPNRCPRPDAVAFSTTIHAWSNSTDPNAPDRAEALLEKITDMYCNDRQKNNKYKPDVVTYTTLVQTWIKSKQKCGPERSETILRELQKMEREGDVGMRPDAACWNSVISAWSGHGDRAEALFFEMMDDPNAANPTAITLTNVLKAWAQCQSSDASDRAVALLEKMEECYREGKLSVKPNAVHYSVVLDALAYARKSSAAEEAERILQKMEASTDPNLRPTVISYNCVMKAWSYARDSRSIMKITSLLRQLIDQAKVDSKLKPNENTFGTIFTFIANSDLADKRKPALAIETVMKTFLSREPKPWIRKELERCLASSTG